MRICIVYDCLFPWTIGGAERWYRSLAERLAADGHHVTYLTMTQWDDGAPPAVAGVELIAVTPRLALYQDGKRRIAPPVRFGLGVFAHLARHGSRYDVVHLCSFPYFALLAAGMLRPLNGYRIVCDWFEIWSRDYWRGYLGRFGWIGWTVQRLCARVPQRARVFSRLHERRLQALGLRGSIAYLPGLSEATASRPSPARTPPTVVFAGRMIVEKRLPLLVEAIALLRGELPTLRAILFGNGPERSAIEAHVREAGLADIVSLPGFVDADVLERAMREATCIVQPSEREGYGLVVVEGSALGVPVIVASGPDNAATELVSPGINGFVVDPPTPEALAQAIARTVRGGETLRRQVRAWYAANAERLSIERSLSMTAEAYAGSALG